MQVCRRFYRLAGDEILWKAKICDYLSLDVNHAIKPPGAVSWKREFQRLVIQKSDTFEIRFPKWCLNVEWSSFEL